jgi:hypothetical protein
MEAYVERAKRNLNQLLQSDIITQRAINLTILHGLDATYSSGPVKNLQYLVATNQPSHDIEELSAELLRIESEQRQLQRQPQSLE